jgi:hypothetical protein
LLNGKWSLEATLGSCCRPKVCRNKRQRVAASNQKIAGQSAAEHDHALTALADHAAAAGLSRPPCYQKEECGIVLNEG